MHLLARTVSGLRVELVVRDHSENFCIQGHHLRSIRFFSHSVARGAVGDGRVVGIDELTNNPNGSFNRPVERTWLVCL